MHRCSECQKEIPTGYFYQDFDLCWDCGREVVRQYNTMRYLAMSEVAKAIKDGRLVKASKCKLCDDSKSLIVGHHWKGYDGPNALDVLWICHGCNVILKGRKYHNGSVSIEEARVIVEASKRARQEKENRPPGRNPKSYIVAFEVGRRKYEIEVAEVQTQRTAINLAREFIAKETGAKETRFLWASKIRHQP